eukprot:SAG22_NODE_1022_length_5991_cov_3.875424_6_plen_174_part_00
MNDHLPSGGGSDSLGLRPNGSHKSSHTAAMALNPHDTAPTTSSHAATAPFSRRQSPVVAAELAQCRRRPEHAAAAVAPAAAGPVRDQHPLVVGLPQDRKEMHLLQTRTREGLTDVRATVYKADWWNRKERRCGHEERQAAACRTRGRDKCARVHAHLSSKGLSGGTARKGSCL